jgi:putative nucleotidyltransferase with HDIG domain
MAYLFEYLQWRELTMPTRDDAYRLVKSHVKNENLQKHMLAVEVAMRFYARQYGEEEELWAMTGLLHDCDYEEYPDLREHTQVSAGWLREGGYDERIIYAILAHNDLNLATHPRNNLLSRALYALDEVTGMITAPRLSPNAIQENYPLSSPNLSPCSACHPHQKNTQPSIERCCVCFCSSPSTATQRPLPECLPDQADPRCCSWPQSR